MAWGDRFKKRVKSLFIRDTDREEEGDEEDASAAKAVQYRLEATRRTRKRGLYRLLITCCGLVSDTGSSTGLAVGINPNQKLAMYLHWMFRVNFVFLFAVMCITFFGLVILFAGFITLAGTLDEECVRIGGEPFNAAGTAFADAFALSWTTVSSRKCMRLDIQGHASLCFKVISVGVNAITISRVAPEFGARACCKMISEALSGSSFSKAS